ncbi:MAG: 50S ribosomal protein L25 [Acidimicrobiia bacterium]|nr:50S ribosomal protein L25 [Acidimicrobiia bacterium]
MDITLRAEAGRSQGSRATRRLRRQGLVPAIVYGQNLDPVAVAVDQRELQAALKTDAGVNAIISLIVEGGDTYTTLAREIQRNPIRPEINHLDFLQISLTETVEADVSVHFEGEPMAIKADGAIIETIRTTVSIEALPAEIPSSITVDISHLELHDVLTVGDLPQLAGVEYLDDPESPLLSISLPSAVLAEEEEAEEGELLEGEEGEEGEGEAGDEDEGDGE